MAGSAEVSYGSGHRSGVLRLETKEAEGRVLVVGEAVPWWLLVTARLSWPVLRTWFEKPPSCSAFVRSYFPAECVGSQCVNIIKNEKDAWLADLRQAEIVLFDRHPRTRSASWVWNSGSVRLIVCSEPHYRKAPPGWHLMALEALHFEVGGVTNLPCVVSVYSKDKRLGQRLKLAWINKLASIPWQFQSLT